MENSMAVSWDELRVVRLAWMKGVLRDMLKDATTV